jgi:glycerophosphoryl diester phosphodiesterase
VRPLRLAHRGDWRAAPENTIAAMLAALEVPTCDGLEFDVRFARDGTPVLLHDATLERVQGVASAVTELDVGALVALGVPTLADVLSAVGREPFLDIELKAPPNDELIRVIEAGRGNGESRLHRAAISSFDPEILAWVAARRPDWRRWLNTRELETPTIERAVDLDCEAVAVLWRALDERSVAKARAAGLEVVAWTVRRRQTFDRIARLGVKAICVEAAALDG